MKYHDLRDILFYSLTMLHSFLPHLLHVKRFHKGNLKINTIKSNQQLKESLIIIKTSSDDIGIIKMKLKRFEIISHCLFLNY